MNPRGVQPIARKLLLVADQRLLVEALLPLFSATEFAVHAASNPTEALAAEAALASDAAMIDLSLVGNTAFELGEQLLERRPGLAILYLDDAPYPLNAQSALRGKARGYWTKQSDFVSLLEALRRMLAGLPAVWPSLAPYLKDSRFGITLAASRAVTALAHLSQREIQVFRLLARGAKVSECARRLQVAQSTVENHKARLMKKLRVHRQVDLMLLALRHGLVRR